MKSKWMRKRWCRAMATVISMGLTAASVLPVMAEEEVATAISVKVLETDGVVEVTNQSGVSMPVFVNMKLLSGYEVVTEEASYAWMVLDDVKMAELDAVSDMKIQRKGDDLALMLDAGNMYFDVTEKLAEDENLQIRTSTMVMGIRGTAGLVKIQDSMSGEVYVMDGVVEALLTNPLTDETDHAFIEAGYVAEYVIYDLGETNAEGKTCEIILRKYEPEEIDGFVLENLKEHPDTLERIIQSGGGDDRLRERVAIADEILKEEQEQMHVKLKESEEKQAEELKDEAKDYVFVEKPVTGTDNIVTPVMPQTEPAPAPKPQQKPKPQPQPETEPETEEETKHVHSFGPYVYNEDATCTKDGTSTATCEECGETDTITEAGSATGHAFGDYTSNNDATCTKDGTQYSICENCGIEDLITDEGSAIGHVFTDYMSNRDATCTEDGTMSAFCMVCAIEDRIPDGNHPALGHDFSLQTGADRETGATLYVCQNRCGKTLYVYPDTTTEIK